MDSSDSEDSDRGIRYKTESTRNDKNLLENDKGEESQNNDYKNDAVFGPSLPPHLQRNSHIGPALPPTVEYPASPPQLQEINTIGPKLPSHLRHNSTDKKSENIEIIGPALPPHLNKNSTENIFGPTLPQNIQKPETDSVSSVAKEENHCIGPVLPDHLKQRLSETHESGEEEDDVYGPMPIGASQSRSHIELEERALQMKIDMLNPVGEKEPAREEWMLKLPPAKAASFGLGPRQFRAKEAPDLSDRTSWTDTPEDKAKKRQSKKKEPQDIKKEAEIRELKKRDKEQESIAKKHKRSKESLVEIHTKKMKKDDSSGPSERRPFSREVDLKVNRFDEAQKKAVLKKAQLLDTRFSAGESKFL